MSIKNTKNILIKNIGDASLGAICWWLLGFGVAFGETSGECDKGSKQQHEWRAKIPAMRTSLRRFSVECRLTCFVSMITQPNPSLPPPV